MEIIERNPKELKPSPHNARLHSDEQIEEIVKSIKEFGYNNPILIDENDVIIAGHGRLEAVKRLNMALVPTVKLEHLTQKQRRAYIIADNKIALNATWSPSLLKTEFNFLMENSFDIEKTGFKPAEVEYFMKKPEDHQFQEFDENIKDERKLIQCPACKHEFVK